MTEINNMRIWDAVSKTDPAHTKAVNFGRKITAIDPYRQIENATREFGPVGMGWGWNVSRVEVFPTNEIGVLVSMWVGNPDAGRFEQWGQASLYTDKAETKKDGDCTKKATTDGITKCLSMLGFNADVFLGKFDDSKYVAQVDAEYREKEAQAVSEGLGDAWEDGIFDSLPEDPSEAAVAEAYVNQLREDALGYKTAKGVNNFLVKRREALNFVEMHLPDVFPALRNDIAEHRDKLEK